MADKKCFLSATSWEHENLMLMEVKLAVVRLEIKACNKEMWCKVQVTAGFLCCFGVKSCFWFGVLLIWSSNDEEEKTSVSCDSLVWTSVHSHGSGSSLQVHRGAAVTTVASHQEGPDSKSTSRPRPLQTCMSAHSSTVLFFLPQSKDTLNLVVLNCT